jgi:PIN domain nuclease of toxin-antitoxin system
VIADTTNDVIVSSASAWEIAIKKALGRLEAPDDLLDVADANGFHGLPITLNHALSAGSLPRHHDDPFDRMLIAQAQSEHLTVVTVDRRFSSYDVDLLPVD